MDEHIFGEFRAIRGKHLAELYRQVGRRRSQEEVSDVIPAELLRLAAIVQEKQVKWIKSEARASNLEITIRDLLCLVEDAKLGDHAIANAARAVLREE